MAEYIKRLSLGLFPSRVKQMIRKQARVDHTRAAAVLSTRPSDWFRQRNGEDTCNNLVSSLLPLLTIIVYLKRILCSPIKARKKIFCNLKIKIFMIYCSLLLFHALTP